MAAFKRAFAALGSVRVSKFSNETINDLRLLHDLYFRLPENFDVAGITPAPSDQRPDQHPGGAGEDLGKPSTKRGGPKQSGGRGKTPRTRGTRTQKTGKTGKTEETGETKETEETGGKQMIQIPPQDPFWTLGPNYTSSICMQRFGARPARKSGAVA